jgi:hypothetical protein
MHLTLDQLSEIVRSLRTDLSAGVGKRRHPRVGLRVNVSLVLPSRDKIQVWVRDISAGGINFCNTAELREGDSFSLLLQNSDGQMEPIPCIVANCQKVASGLFRVGARFVDYNPARRRGRDSKLRRTGTDG